MTISAGTTENGPADAPAEHVVARLRPHARLLFWPTILLFVIAGATGYYAGNLPEPWLNSLLVVGALLAVVLLWLLPVVSWLNRRYTITTRRIIFRHGFFVRTRQELLHSRGYDVTVRQNWLQSAFRSGNVLINSGLEHPLVLKDVPNAALVQKVLHDLMEETRAPIAPKRDEHPLLGETSGFRRGR
ncbi:PH domain-containing protein [Cryobacterium tepidiphilum]|uniref:PH domain-containing protein n=1 Tax=Cryobacterium tepidiphilum TaxID=2486026 RepID=A0A3M8L0N8_9MICO|nr:PH domain-containing protein [Cryobacterium tepidiphilum]RNE59101.1 PH domain-containing protein [Cryobacterium tepidiphilum]